MTADSPYRPTSRPGGGRCPTCGKPAVEATRPFCSARCRDVDLGRWLTESYVVAGHRPVDEGEQDDLPPDRGGGRLPEAD